MQLQKLQIGTLSKGGFRQDAFGRQGLATDPDSKQIQLQEVQQCESRSCDFVKALNVMLFLHVSKWSGYHAANINVSK